MQVARGDLGSEFLERRDVVEHEQSAAVRRNHQIVLPRHELHVPHGSRGEAAPDLFPGGAVVARVEQPCVGAEDEETALVRILSDHPRRIRRGQAARQVDPGLPVVGGPEDIWAVVVELVVVHREVGGARVER